MGMRHFVYAAAACLFFLACADMGRAENGAGQDEGRSARDVEVIYSSGEKNSSWLDMGYPYTTEGTVEVRAGMLYPAAIYGSEAGYYAHTVNLHFDSGEPRDLEFAVDFLSQSGRKIGGGSSVLKVLLNGKVIREILLQAEGEKLAKASETIAVPAQEGENVLTLDMSSNPGWENCWFDSVRLCEVPLEDDVVEPEEEE